MKEKKRVAQASALVRSHSHLTSCGSSSSTSGTSSTERLKLFTIGVEYGGSPSCITAVQRGIKAEAEAGGNITLGERDAGGKTE